MPLGYPADQLSLASNLPPMIVFPKLSTFYTDWQQSLTSKGVKVRLSTEVTRIISRTVDCVQVGLRKRVPSPDKHNPLSDELPESAAFAGDETIEEFDEVVMCVLADTAKSLLGRAATWLEGKVLGGARFSDDVTVTHWDTDYMQKWYVNQFDDSLAVDSLGGGRRDETTRVRHGATKFKPYVMTSSAHH